MLVVEAKSELRAQDFDALAATVDPWVESHGGLRGLVIHAREFPGWENLGGMFRHIRFIRNHHRSIGRIALASDSTLASLAPHLTEHFVEANVQHFDHDALERAIGWAGEARD